MTQTQQSGQAQIDGIEGILIERKRKFNKLPKVFIEGHTHVKISLIKFFIHCAEYKFGFEGCYVYDSEKDALRPSKGGIFYVPPYPFIQIEARFAYDKREAREAIMEQIEFIKRHIRPRGKLLIDYNYHGYMRIYDNVVEGMMIKFPLVYQEGMLYVLNVPQVPYSAQLRNNIINIHERIRLYDYTISFNKEVVVYHIEFVYYGVASLIYNINSDPVEARISLSDHEEKITLDAGKTYLFVHPTPPRD
jgi:hypothetical protein